MTRNQRLDQNGSRIESPGYRMWPASSGCDTFGLILRSDLFRASVSSELSNGQNLEEAGWWHFFLLDSFFLGGVVPNICLFRIFVGAKNVCVCVADIKQIYEIWNVFELIWWYGKICKMRSSPNIGNCCLAKHPTDLKRMVFWNRAGSLGFQVLKSLAGQPNTPPPNITPQKQGFNTPWS